MKYIKRDIEPLLLKAVKQFPAVVLTGARQTGKSTLLKKLFPNFSYANLDTLKSKSYASEDPQGFLNDHPCPVIIDEIQEVPELLSYIKENIDSKRNKKGQYLITGSQQFSLMEGVQESLAGRAAIMDLAGFSMHETQSLIKSHTWPEIVLKGSYPELCVNPKIDKELWYSSYIKSVINRDIAKHIKEANLFTYEKFIILLAARISQEINYSDIGKELGVDYKTIQTWIYFLQRSQIIFFIQPYIKNLGKRLTKKPKLYFYDSGLVAYLTGHTAFEQIKNGSMSGAFFENLVISEFIKQNFTLAHQKHFCFYRDSNKLEVDLIINEPSSIRIIEIKSTATPKIDHTKNLIKLNEIIGDDCKMFLISTSQDQSKPKGVKYLNFKELDLASL